MFSYWWLYIMLHVAGVGHPPTPARAGWPHHPYPYAGYGNLNGMKYNDHALEHDWPKPPVDEEDARPRGRK